VKYFAEEQALINPVDSSSFQPGSSFEGDGGISGHLLSHLTKPEMRSKYEKALGLTVYPSDV
jgi:hypothetical protein